MATYEKIEYVPGWNYKGRPLPNRIGPLDWGEFSPLVHGKKYPMTGTISPYSIHYMELPEYRAKIQKEIDELGYTIEDKIYGLGAEQGDDNAAGNSNMETPVTSRQLPAPLTPEALTPEEIELQRAIQSHERDPNSLEFKPVPMPMPAAPKVKIKTAPMPMPAAPRVEIKPVPPKPALGASSTTTENIASPQTGALGNLGLTSAELKALGGQSNITSAIKLATALSPKEDPVNPWEAALLYFTEMGKQASKPGATALGAAVSSGTPALAYLLKKRDAERKRKAAILPTAVSLAAAMKPKTGVPKSVMGGPVTNEDGSPALDPTTKKPLYQYNTYDAAGTVIGTFQAPMKGGGVNINTAQEGAMAKALGKEAATQYTALIDASRGAESKLDNLRQMGSLLRDPNFKTGKFQEFMLPFRQWAKSLGLGKVDSRIDDMEKQVTVPGVDGVVNAELFRAKASQLVLDSVAQMKGALSDKELTFLASINPSLGQTKEANQILILLAQQQLEKIAPFQDFSITWQDENGLIKNENDFNKMARDFQKRPEIQGENPYQYIIRKSDEYEIRLLDEQEKLLKIKLPRQSDGTLIAPEAKEDPEITAIRSEITYKINNAFPIAVIRNIFKGSAFYNK